jgi:hypothetical protein
VVDFVVSERDIVREDTIGELEPDPLGPGPDLKGDEDLDIADLVVLVALDALLVSDSVVDDNLW